MRSDEDGAGGTEEMRVSAEGCRSVAGWLCDGAECAPCTHRLHIQRPMATANSAPPVSPQQRLHASGATTLHRTSHHPMADGGALPQGVRHALHHSSGSSSQGLAVGQRPHVHLQHDHHPSNRRRSSDRHQHHPDSGGFSGFGSGGGAFGGRRSSAGVDTRHHILDVAANGDQHLQPQHHQQGTSASVGDGPSNGAKRGRGGSGGRGPHSTWTPSEVGWCFQSCDIWREIAVADMGTRFVCPWAAAACRRYTCALVRCGTMTFKACYIRKPNQIQIKFPETPRNAPRARSPTRRCRAGAGWWA